MRGGKGRYSVQYVMHAASVAALGFLSPSLVGVKLKALVMEYIVRRERESVLSMIYTLSFDNCSDEYAMLTTENMLLPALKLNKVTPNGKKIGPK